MSNYTKGPWTVNVMDSTNSIAIECEIDGIGHTIVTDQFCYPNFQKHGSYEKLANAKLIAASPDLLEALVSLYNAIDSCVELTPEILNKANAAIKKATS